MPRPETFPAIWIEEAVALRHDLHRHPELQFDLPRTTERIIATLERHGVDEIVPGVGKSGVVAVIRGTRPGLVRALRADMDALPIREASGVNHASEMPGRMHACGHDGHVAMLLLAARHLAENRNFPGVALLVFQPAEENGGAGAREMLRDGLVDRFGPQEMYGLHVMPGLEKGHFATRVGGIMASADVLRIEISGTGGHAALPHLTVDPLLIASHTHVALQSILSRNLDPVASAVVSITMIACGENEDTIAPTAIMRGTVRTLDEAARDLCEQRITQIAQDQARSFGGHAQVSYVRDYPVTANAPAPTAHAAASARQLGPVDDKTRPKLVSEDFGFYCAELPSAFMFLGQGPGPGLHDPRFDFDDSLLPIGAAYWVSLMRTDDDMSAANPSISDEKS